MGLFLVVSVLRTVWKVPLRWVLLVLYAAVFLLSFLPIPRNMLAVAFDAGGVTTGPITVPFIMALGLGVSATRGTRTAKRTASAWWPWPAWGRCWRF